MNVHPTSCLPTRGTRMHEIAPWILKEFRDVLEAIDHNQRKIYERQEKIIMAFNDLAKLVSDQNTKIQAVQTATNDLGTRIQALTPDTSALESQVTANNAALDQVAQQLAGMAQPAAPPATPTA